MDFFFLQNSPHGKDHMHVWALNFVISILYNNNNITKSIMIIIIILKRCLLSIAFCCNTKNTKICFHNRSLLNRHSRGTLPEPSL